MGQIDPALRDRVERWVAQDPDPDDRAELLELLESDDVEGLTERFSGRLAFGTAGLRGRMGAGPRRMNRLVVRQSAAGIARYLVENVADARTRGVVVIHDARHRSERFAQDCAEVLTGHGIPVIAGIRPLPTPVGVFAIRELGCSAGIVVTASHNPSTDNGLKLYLGDAAQIIPPVDGLVAGAIEAVVDDGQLVPQELARAFVAPMPSAVVDAYVGATLARVPPGGAGIRVTVTAMHGVGGGLLERVLDEAGFDRVTAVAEQHTPDPDFPTVEFPNPEEPGALDLLKARMESEGADIGLALDPDADRLAVVLPQAGEALQLTGDEVGALLGEWLLGKVTSGPNRLVVSSVVSSTLLGAVAEHHGATHVETATGFKWLSRPAMEHPSLTQVLAYEEALGYAIGADVRDKDGISAALAMAAMAAGLRRSGQTVPDVLDEIHRRSGAYATNNFSLRDEQPGAAERRDRTIARLKEDPPDAVAGVPVREIREVFPGVLSVETEGDVRIMVRPSGTEPKLKCYCEAVEPVGDDGLESARARAKGRLESVQDALTRLLVS